jgi:flagellar hook assembly protein FlgD
MRRFDLIYELPRGGPVSLRITDAAGRCLRTLVDQVADRGKYVSRWDGLDDRGVPVPAGIYFAQLRTAEGAGVRSVVVVR